MDIPSHRTFAPLRPSEDLTLGRKAPSLAILTVFWPKLTLWRRREIADASAPLRKHSGYTQQVVLRF
jgi:hypothetical protein